MDDEPRHATKDLLEAVEKEDLDSWSKDALAQRILRLKAEIARSDAEIAKKDAGRAAAEAFFK